MYILEKETQVPIWALPSVYELHILDIYLSFADEETKALSVFEDLPYKVILRSSNKEHRTPSTGLALSRNSLNEDNRLK